jgi:hypothetical protein
VLLEIAPQKTTYMALLSLIRKRKKTLLIRPTDIALPTLDLDDFVPANMLLDSADFTFLQGSVEHEVSLSKEIIQPFGVPFGLSSKMLSRYIKRPSIIINNQENIPNHEIHLIRRKLGKIIIASQFHFINERLFYVVDEFNRQRDYLERAFKHSLNGYFLMMPNITGEDVDYKTLKDKEGHYLLVEYQNYFVARYYSPQIWKENHDA